MTDVRAVAAGVVPLMLALLVAPAAPAAPPTAEEVLEKMGFDDDAKKKVMAGEFVRIDAKPSTDREISVSMAFLVKVPPNAFLEDALAGMLMDVDPDSKAHGKIEGEPAVAQLTGLKLNADAAKKWRKASPGSDMNLSHAEYQAMAGLDKMAERSEVEVKLRELMVNRLKAYQKNGLAGIAPYDRGDGKTLAGGDELKSATQAQAEMGLKKLAPDFYEVLSGYPAAKPSKEVFRWQSYEAHGTPVVILTHGFSVTLGDVIVVCQRQFYVSGSYNVEQATAGFFPVNEGTLVTYTNRTSSDQVSGFGGGGKRAIGRKLMGKQLEDVFHKMRTKAAQ